MYMLPSVVWQSKDPRLQTRFGKHSPFTLPRICGTAFPQFKHWCNLSQLEEETHGGQLSKIHLEHGCYNQVVVDHLIVEVHLSPWYTSQRFYSCIVKAI